MQVNCIRYYIIKFLTKLKLLSYYGLSINITIVPFVIKFNRRVFHCIRQSTKCRWQVLYIPILLRYIYIIYISFIYINETCENRYCSSGVLTRERDKEKNPRYFVFSLLCPVKFTTL